MRRDPRIIRHPYSFAARPARVVVAQPIATSTRPEPKTVEHSLGPIHLKRFDGLASGDRVAQLKVGRSFVNVTVQGKGKRTAIGYLITDWLVVSVDLPGWPRFGRR